MSEQEMWPYDEDVAAALSKVVEDHGVRGLSQPSVLGNLLSDFIPDAPRETSLLMTAAEMDVPGALARAIGDNMDPDSAVRVTAAHLGEARMIAPEGCLWATARLAEALGHKVTVDPSVPPVAEGPGPYAMPGGGAPGVAEGEAPTVNPGQSPPASPGGLDPTVWPPAGPAPAAGSWGTPAAPAGTPPAGGWAAVIPPAQSSSAAPSGPWPAPAPVDPDADTADPSRPGPWTPDAEGPGQVATAPEDAEAPDADPPDAGAARGGRVKAGLGAGGVVVLVAAYLITAGVAGIFPFSSSSAASRKPVATAAATQLTLANLMPYSDRQNENGYDTSSCNPVQALGPAHFAGLMGDGLSCPLSSSGFSGWTLSGYKFTNSSTYAAGLKAYNAAIGFDGTAAEPACPPTTGGRGEEAWYTNPEYATTAGQIVECFTTGTGSQAAITYLWTLPTQNTFFELVAAPGTKAQEVDSWWQANGQPGS